MGTLGEHFYFVTVLRGRSSLLPGGFGGPLGHLGMPGGFYGACGTTGIFKSGALGALGRTIVVFVTGFGSVVFLSPERFSLGGFGIFLLSP